MLPIYLAVCLVAVVGYGLVNQPLVVVFLAAVMWAFCWVLSDKK
jgi:hypothetical protein